MLAAAEEKEANPKQYVKEEKPSKIEEVREPVKKKKTKQANAEYLVFFRHYFERYTREHPNWDKSQIQSIIRLLWKTRKRKNRVAAESVAVRR